MTEIVSSGPIAIGAAVWLLILNLGAVSAFAEDKRRAAARERRYSEASLLTLVLLGGGPGAWIGMRLFRHKTRKASFQAAFRTIVAVQLLAAGVATWALFGRA